MDKSHTTREKIPILALILDDRVGDSTLSQSRQLGMFDSDSIL